MATKKFIYGIAVVKFNGKEIGYIEKGSWDWGGSKAESTDIEAEQVPDAPVLTLANKNATIAPTSEGSTPMRAAFSWITRTYRPCWAARW